MPNLLTALVGLNHWQLDFLVAGLLLQGALIAVFPEEVILTAVGIALSRHQLIFIEAVVVVQIGLLPANASWFFIGKKFGRKILKTPAKFLFKKRDLAYARILFRTSGERVIAVTRFIPVIRGPIYLSAGMCRLSVSRFLFWDFAASCFQIPMLLGLGMFLGRRSESVLDAYKTLGSGLALVVVLIIGSKLVVNLLQRIPLT